MYASSTSRSPLFMIYFPIMKRISCHGAPTASSTISLNIAMFGTFQFFNISVIVWLLFLEVESVTPVCCVDIICFLTSRLLWLSTQYIFSTLCFILAVPTVFAKFSAFLAFWGLLLHTFVSFTAAKNIAFGFRPENLIIQFSYQSTLNLLFPWFVPASHSVLRP